MFSFGNIPEYGCNVMSVSDYEYNCLRFGTSQLLGIVLIKSCDAPFDGQLHSTCKAIYTSVLQV